jgi:hypothetical protein
VNKQTIKETGKKYTSKKEIKERRKEQKIRKKRN